MNTTTDRPTTAELDRLSNVLRSTPLDRGALAASLCELEQGLYEHARELARSGGLLDEQEQASRMSLAREDDRLREESIALIRDARSLREAAEAGGDEADLRVRASRLLAELRGHRDAEAGLVLESADTEVGAGD